MSTLTATATKTPRDDVRVEYASASLRDPNAPAKITAAREFCRKQGWVFGVQVHNSETRNHIRRLAKLGLPLSWHGPLLSKYFANLANENVRYAEKSLKKTVKIMRQYDPSLCVFHGFLMTDTPVLAFNRRRGFERCMSAGARPELHREDGRLVKAYFDTPEYVQRLQRTKHRLASLRTEYPDIEWCIENDFPVYSGGLLLAEQMNQLETPLCLDTSHLWTVCVLFERDFHEEVRQLAEAGRVRCVHLHASTLTRKNPGKWRDGHLPLDVPNEMDLPRLVRMLDQAGMRHWILETPHASLTDLRALAAWLE